VGQCRHKRLAIQLLRMARSRRRSSSSGRRRLNLLQGLFTDPFAHAVQLVRMAGFLNLLNWQQCNGVRHVLRAAFHLLLQDLNTDASYMCHDTNVAAFPQHRNASCYMGPLMMMMMPCAHLCSKSNAMAAGPE
jgi:hypothetical protein